MGAVLAEFALTAPLLLLLLLGTAQLGIAYGRARMIDAAAHEAGRMAALSSTSEIEVVARAEAALAGGAGGNSTVAVDPTTCAGRQGESVTVTITTPHRIAIPLAFEREVTLTGRAVFRCEA